MDELTVAEPTSQSLARPAGPPDVELPMQAGAEPDGPRWNSKLWLTGAVTVGVLAVCVTFVWLQLNPHLVLKNNTPSGGDMGAHVWGPAYLRDHLLPHFRLTGWTNDWYDGFPAYQYYMVVPALAIVVLNAVVPYGVAFKLITVSGLLLLPVGAYVMGRLFRLNFPGPALLAVATVPFLFDTSFTIYGGNIASTLAGEFAFSISLFILLLYLGFLARGLETGRYRVVTAGLFALVALCHPIPLLGMATLGTLAIGGWHLVRALWSERRWHAFRSTLWWIVSTAGLGSALTGFWIVPFLMRHTYFNDMGWERLPTSRSRVLYYLFHFGTETGTKKGLDLLSTVPLLWFSVLVLAVIGVGLSWVFRHQLGCVLSLVALGLIVMFMRLPQGWLWNARLLPFWYLTLYFLAAVGLYHLVQLVRSTPVRAGVLVGALLVVLLCVSLPLGVLPGSHRTTDGRMTALGLKAKESFVKSWAKWNYSGYEGKDAYPEYYQVITKMTEVGQQRGCGRAMWEYDNDRLNSYGTPMSLMLLPYWTNGCIASQEGLYFEASSTTPYHFLMQSELSTRPSRPQRKLPYRDLDLTLGVKQMQLMGVRYYMAFTERAVSAANSNPDLQRIGQVGGDQQRVTALKASSQLDQAAIDRASPWVIYEVRNAPLVQALKYKPVVVTDVDQHQKSWLQPSAAFFGDPARWDPFPAATGPSDWPRAAISSPELPRTPMTPAIISNVKSTESGVSFNVDQQTLGSPVLVKTSYFPNWHVKGAKGPYRVMPNLMVVVPTSTTVKLSYGYTPIDALGWGLTLLGLAGLAILLLRPPLLVGQRRRATDTEQLPSPGSVWLTSERDPNLGWVWAAPDQPLDGSPPLLLDQPVHGPPAGAPVDARGHTTTDQDGWPHGRGTFGVPIAPLPPTTPESHNGAPNTPQADRPPPPPPLPGSNGRSGPAIYNQPGDIPPLDTPRRPHRAEGTHTVTDESAEDRPRRPLTPPGRTDQAAPPSGEMVRPADEEVAAPDTQPAPSDARTTPAEEPDDRAPGH
ncbi:MAG: hypothetical protein QOJ19_1605 [Acidimicrobiia bacterium]|jgi:hypothetical protein|nr:hypothetical protein [Acidimicrobiia bacterium]